jgi:putative membrane protein
MVVVWVVVDMVEEDSVAAAAPAVVGVAAEADLAEEAPVAVGEIPNFLSRYLKQEDLAQIASAVSKAESKTSAEIVPMIVKSSSSVGAVPYLAGLLLFSLGLILDRAFDLELIWGIGGYLILGLLVLSAIGGFYLAQYQFIRQILTPDNQRDQAVQLRAELEFHRLNMVSTIDRTGVLLFISMAERQVVVLGDLTIDKKLGKVTWDAFITDFLSQMKTGDLKGGLLGFIDKCGGLLAENFPISAQDTNEIPNDLVIKE